MVRNEFSLKQKVELIPQSESKSQSQRKSCKPTKATGTRLGKDVSGKVVRTYQLFSCGAALIFSECSDSNDYHKSISQLKTLPSPTPPEMTITPTITKWAVTRKKTVSDTGNSSIATSNPALTSHMNTKSKNQNLKGLKVGDAVEILSNRAVATTVISNGQGEIEMSIQSGVGQSHVEDYDTTILQEMHKERLERAVELSRVKSELVDCSTDSAHDGENVLSGHSPQSLVAQHIVLPFSLKTVKGDMAGFVNGDPCTSTLLRQPLSNPASKYKDLHSTPDNSQLKILKTLLKLTIKERDCYKTQNDNLLRRIHSLENQLIELTQKTIKKNLCHK
ncbi:uncharacterized protein LOC125484442 [Rhincodon typus]|uniref:uncharacterized protein LOC125484442 n=1 Tax=Rhincodon typus TaxID=259920 RepID=UPI00202E2FAE|nr:uncharacterized protein LOC125484442 [Rhincodon typus]